MAQGALGEEFDLSFSGEAGAEYASGLRYDHDNVFETPPLRLKDFRYTFELSANATYGRGPFDFRAAYTFNQRTYDDLNTFHRRRHEAIAQVTGDTPWGVNLGLRYRYRISQPEGRAGIIESNQIRGRAVLPRFSYTPLGLNVEPATYALWQTADFHKLRFLTGETWETGVEFALSPFSNSWTADTTIAYGITDTRERQVTHAFVDVSMELSSDTERFFEESWMGPIALALELGYREEWYEGLGSDLGTQQHNRISGFELTARRDFTNHIGAYARTSFDDHESNWEHDDFNEVVAGVGLSFSY